MAALKISALQTPGKVQQGVHMCRQASVEIFSRRQLLHGDLANRGSCGHFLGQLQRLHQHFLAFPRGVQIPNLGLRVERGKDSVEIKAIVYKYKHICCNVHRIPKQKYVLEWGASGLVGAC